MACGRREGRARAIRCVSMDEAMVQRAGRQVREVGGRTKPASMSTRARPSLTTRGSSAHSTRRASRSAASRGFQPSSVSGLLSPWLNTRVTRAGNQSPTVKRASRDGTSSSSSSSSPPALEDDVEAEAERRAVRAAESEVRGTWAYSWDGSERTRWSGWIEWMRVKSGVPGDRRCEGETGTQARGSAPVNRREHRREGEPAAHLVVQVLDACMRDGEGRGARRVSSWVESQRVPQPGRAEEQCRDARKWSPSSSFLATSLPFLPFFSSRRFFCFLD